MTHEYLMQGMSVQHIRFTVRPTESVVFAEQAGSALRGGLYEALSKHFCSEPEGAVTPDHAQRCPVCWLLALEDEQAQRGRDVPRPLTIEPPQPRTYHRGEVFSFGCSLIGQAQDLFPYLARAVQHLGVQGVGKGRGRFDLVNIAERNPLLNADRTLLDGSMVRRPTLQITPPRIAEAAASGRADRITLKFITPLRLIADGKLVKSPDPAVFMQRLLERCQNLADRYAETDAPASREQWRQAAVELQTAAQALRTGYNDTAWLDSWSGSRRKGYATPIGGLVGVVRWEGDVLPLRSWLLWGQSLHVGKDAVKGNGWYQITD